MVAKGYVDRALNLISILDLRRVEALNWKRYAGRVKLLHAGLHAFPARPSYLDQPRHCLIHKNIDDFRHFPLACWSYPKPTALLYQIPSYVHRACYKGGAIAAVRVAAFAPYIT